MRHLADSELIINADGSIFHLHLKPEQLADRIILCGDPARVAMIGRYFETGECDVANREFHSITGTYRGKRITAVSHGIGCDNMDIVVGELDALANIDFERRTVRPTFRRLTMVRIGTSGGLQPFTPTGTFVAAEKSVGFDGVVYFYRDHELFRDKKTEDELIRHLDWKITGVRPYVVTADAALTERIAGDDIVRGITIAANGFYGPQGRELRLPLADPELNSKIESFHFENRHITNFEMESSALAGLAAMMGHRAVTVCCIIVGRRDKNLHADCTHSLSLLIEKILDRI